MEVNISSTTRNAFIKQINQWDEKWPLLTDSTVQKALEDDEKSRIKAFEKAYKEISLMLYQNLWVKFRSAEMATSMSSNVHQAPNSGITDNHRKKYSRQIEVMT